MNTIVEDREQAEDFTPEFGGATGGEMVHRPQAPPAARQPNVVEMPNPNATVIVKMSDDVAELFGAIAAAQAEDGYGDIEKSKSARIKMKAGGEYGYDYETLADVLAATRPHLAKHGVATMQFAFPGQRSVTIRTMLAHKSGQWISNDLSALIAMPEPKDVGGGISYLRRYALKAICGVAAADGDEDDHGERTARNSTAPKAAERRSQQRPDASVKPQTAPSSAPPAAAPPAVPAASAVVPPFGERIGTVKEFAMRGAGALARLDTGFTFAVKDPELVKAVESHHKRGTRIEAICVPSSDPSKYAPVLTEITQQGG